MSFEANLDKILERHNDLSEKLASGILGEEYVKASKDYSELEPIVAKINEYKKVLLDLKGAREMVRDSSLDHDTKQMAEEEVGELSEALEKIEYEVKISLLPKDEADKKGAIIEIRGGTGGEEAALFAADLFNMYQRF